MAIGAWQKDVVLENGVSIGYWVLTRIDFKDVQSKIADVSYCGWLDQDHYDQGKPKIIEKSFSNMDLSAIAQGGTLANAVSSLIQAREVAENG